MAKGWDRDLVARLSPSSSQVLLSLLLSGQAEVRDSQAEFAKTTGLGQRTIAPALLELESEGLVHIIAQPGKPSIVRLVQAEGVRGETTVTEADPYVVTSTDRPLLRGGAAESGEGTGRRVGEKSNEQPPDDSGGSGGLAVPKGGGLDEEATTEVPPVEEGSAIPGGVEQVALPIGRAAYEVPATATAPVDSEEALIDQCREFDAWTGEGKRDLQVSALQDVWDYAFPYAEYPTQRLTNEGARRMLSSTNQVNRSAEWVGQVILSAVKNARGKISNPRAYIETALANEERRGKGETKQDGGISDELRRLAQLGKEQFGAKNKDSPGHIE